MVKLQSGSFRTGRSNGVTNEGTSKAAKRSAPQQIVAKLRQVEVLATRGKPVVEPVRAIGMPDLTCATGCRMARCPTPRRRKGEQMSRLLEVELGSPDLPRLRAGARPLSCHLCRGRAAAFALEL